MTSQAGEIPREQAKQCPQTYHGNSGEASLQLGHCKWGSGVCVCGVCSGSYNLQASVQPLGFVFGTETAEGKGIHNLFNPVEIVADIISGQKNAKLFSALLVC